MGLGLLCRSKKKLRLHASERIDVTKALKRVCPPLIMLCGYTT